MAAGVRCLRSGFCDFRVKGFCTDRSGPCYRYMLEDYYCAARVPRPSGNGYRQCSRAAGHGVGGRYCKQHAKRPLCHDPQAAETPETAAMRRDTAHTLGDQEHR